MKRSILLIAALAAAMIAVVAPAKAQQQGQPEETDALDIYTATVTPEQAAELSQEGVDIIRSEPAGADVEVDVVLTDAESERLEARTGVDLQLKRNAQGQTAREAAELQAEGGFTSGGRGTSPGASATSCTRSPPTTPSS